MKLKALSLYRDFVDFLHREAHRTPKHVRIGDLLLTTKLVNTAEISSESKLTYAYLFFHREDVNGVQVPILSRHLGMSTEQTRSTLNELTSKNYIKLITTRKSADLSQLSYYYKIVDPSKFGMPGLEEELYQPEEE